MRNKLYDNISLSFYAKVSVDLNCLRCFPFIQNVVTIISVSATFVVSLIELALGQKISLNVHKV